MRTKENKKLRMGRDYSRKKVARTPGEQLRGSVRKELVSKSGKLVKKAKRGKKKKCKRNERKSGEKGKSSLRDRTLEGGGEMKKGREKKRKETKKVQPGRGAIATKGKWWTRKRGGISQGRNNGREGGGSS